MPVYDNFVTAFVSNNFQALFEALESGTNGMREDHFLGLVSLLNTYTCHLIFDICCYAVLLFEDILLTNYNDGEELIEEEGAFHLYVMTHHDSISFLK